MSPCKNLYQSFEDRERVPKIQGLLNVNKSPEPVRALGKMLLQNLQLVVGKRYESDVYRRRTNKPLFSVVLDEPSRVSMAKY